MTMTAQIAKEARSVCIAEQNDKFRKHVLKCFGMAPAGIPGLLVQTRSVADMSVAELGQLYAAIHVFSDFDAEENDPHGEHDFGSVKIADEKFFWKIDYYADSGLKFGSEDPANPAQTYRVMTVMRASEY